MRFHIRRAMSLRVLLVGAGVLLSFGALGGCRTTNYTAANMPAELRVAAPTTSKEINLEQMAGAGVGTSQVVPGDLVEITIVSGNGEEKAIPTPARVGQDGTVMVPLIGGVQIGGLEPVAAEQQIAAAAIERGIYRQPYVTLKVTERAVNRVTVLGAVARPGVVELPRGSCDLASALAAAGGLTKEAGTRVEILHRADGSPITAGPTKDGSASTDTVQPASYNGNTASNPMFPEPGLVRTSVGEMSRLDLAQTDATTNQNRKLADRDVVMVLPEETRVIHVTGLVVKPNQFELPRDKDIRVLDAVAMAGGISSPVADKVLVIRQMPNMKEPAVIKVKMSAAKRNGDENLRLAPGDLVSVESTVTTMTLDTVTKFFRVGLGLSSSVATF